MMESFNAGLSLWERFYRDSAADSDNRGGTAPTGLELI